MGICGSDNENRGSIILIPEVIAHASSIILFKTRGNPWLIYIP